MLQAVILKDDGRLAEAMGGGGSCINHRGEAAVTACKATKYENHPAYVWVRFRSPITTRGRSACTPHLAWSLLVS
jgi:hypothetical protein